MATVKKDAQQDKLLISKMMADPKLSPMGMMVPVMYPEIKQLMSDSTTLKQKQLLYKRIPKPMLRYLAEQMHVAIPQSVYEYSGAEIFAMISRANPGKKWESFNWAKNSKSLKWSDRSITKDSACQTVQDTLARFETNIIPHSTVPACRQISIAFLKDGISSSLDIVDKYTAKTFVDKYQDIFNKANAGSYIEKAYNNALEIRSRILMHYMNIQGITESHYSAIPWSTSITAAASGIDKLPNYQGLFGNDIYQEIDHDNSVLSPAAYLYELKGFADKYIQNSDAESTFEQRRPDIGVLPLSGENTSTEVTKLEIVNRVLEARLKSYDSAYSDESLAESFYPLSKPFSLPYEQVLEYIKLLGSDLASVWDSCTLDGHVPDPDYQADLSFYSSDVYQKALKKVINVTPPAKGGKAVKMPSVEGFRHVFGITYQQLDEVIAADLSDAEMAKGLGSNLYVNAGEKQAVIEIDPASKTLKNLTPLRLKKIAWLVKLSKDSGISITDLQSVLQMFSELEGYDVLKSDYMVKALPYVTQVKNLQQQFSISTNEAIGLIGHLKDTGEKDGDSFMNTIFPPVLVGQSWDYTATDDDSIEMRYALIGAVGVMDPDFGHLISFVKDQFTAAGSKSIAGNKITLDREILSALYRVGKLMNVLKISISDVAILLGLQSGEAYAGPVTAHSRNSAILMSLISDSTWLQQQGWASYQLNYYMNGRFGENQGDLSADAFAKLQSGIGSGLAQLLVTDTVLQAPIDSTLAAIKGGFSTAKIMLGEAEISGAALLAILQKQQVLSTQRLSGIILKIPDNQTLLAELTANKLSFTDVPDADFNLCAFYLLRKIREDLIAGWKKQQTAISTAVQGFFSIDQSFSNDFSLWGKFLLPAQSAAYIVAEEQDANTQLVYFNTLSRFNKLITALKLSADDVSKILRGPSITDIGDTGTSNPVIDFTRLKALALIPVLKTKYSDSSGVLFDYQKNPDTPILAGLTQWNTDDINAILTHWGLNGLNFDSSVSSSYDNKGANAISFFDQKTVLGYQQYNEIVIQQPEGMVIVAGYTGGNLGVDVAMQENFVVAIDANKKQTHICQSDGSAWYRTFIISHTDSPRSIALNDEYCAVAFANTIEIYRISDMKNLRQGQSAVVAQSISSKDEISRVFLDSKISSNCGYITSNKACSIYDLNTNKVTAPAKAVAGLFAELAGGVLLSTGDTAALDYQVATKLSPLSEPIDFKTLQANDVWSSVVDYSKDAVLDIAMHDNKAMLLTKEKVLTFNMFQFLLTDIQTFVLVDKLDKVFDLVAKTGITVKTLLNIAGLSRKGSYADWKTLAQHLENTAKAKYKSEDWNEVFKPFNIVLQEKQRNVLVDELLYRFSKDKSNYLNSIRTHEDLSEYLLIDVDVTALVTTSYVKEAISALQLYIYRCQMNIEPQAVVDEQFNDYWAWMRNYSVWEANRLVFLYPENYLEPELRKGRTPLFDEFNGFLKRNKVSPEHIDNAYKKYLDGFLSIANLKIVNIRVHNRPEEESKELIIIGRTTESDGYKYYFRIAGFKVNPTLNAYVPDDWGAWQEISTKIPTKWITPITAFGRLYVFWVELKPYSGSDDDKKGTGLATLKCCFYNYRGKWSVPQTLVDRIGIKASPESAEERDHKVYHQLSVDSTGDSIVITYTDESSQKTHIYHLDPHMQVTADEESSILAPVVKYDKTNNAKGFLGIGDAYQIPKTKQPKTNKQEKILNLSCPGGQGFTISGWVLTGADLSKDQPLFLISSTSGQLLGFAKIELLIKGQSKTAGKLNISGVGVTIGPSIATFDTGQTLKANTWYYIAVQFSRETSFMNLRHYFTYSAEKLMLIAGKAQNKQLTGDPVFVDCRFKLQCCAQLMGMIPNPAAMLAMKLKKEQMVVSFYAPKVRNIGIYNGLAPIGVLKKASGVKFDTNEPVVHVGSKAIDCYYIANSDQRMILMESGSAAYLIVEDNRNAFQYAYRLTTSVAKQFDSIYSKSIDGVSALLSTSTQGIPETPFASLNPDKTKMPQAYWPEDSFIDLEGADGVYYWELFFYVPWLLAKSYSTDSQFESAKQWYQYIFNPLEKASGENSKLADPNDRFWSFVGLKTENNMTLRYEHFGEPTFELISEVSGESELKPKWDSHLPALKKYHDDPFDPHAIARLRPVAYQKCLFKCYIDNIIAWADDLYRENTRETLEEAYMLYSVASDLLGKRPQSAGVAAAPQPETLNQLENMSKGTVEFLVGIESALAHSGALDASAIDNPNNHITSSYFGVPENKKFIESWDKVDNRLYNLRHQLTIDGEPNSLPLFQPPANPMALIAAAASGSGTLQPHAAHAVEVPAYRYTTISVKAQAMTSYLMRFGSELQSALRGRDMSVLSELRASQQLEIMKMMDEVKQSAVKTAQKQLESTKLSLEKTTYRHDYYDALLYYGTKKTADLQRYRSAMGLKDTGLVLTELATILMAMGSDLSFVRMIAGPFSGLIFGMSDGGSNTAAIPGSASHALGQLGFAYQTQAGVLEQMAAQLEQAQHYFFNRKEAADQIKEINKRIEIAEVRLKAAEKQYDIHKTRIAQNEKVLSFYQDKFLDEELYTWMIQQLTFLYKQAYQMAYQLALETQKCWQYEIGDDSTEFITSYYWDSAYRGFLAGETLESDLLRMDKAYYERNKRSFEIKKTISLTQVDPIAFLTLVQTGSCHFSLNESLFNADYPGHYMRRIKSVSLTLGLAGGSTAPGSINATLTQLGNRVVMQPDIDLVSYLQTGKTTKGTDSLDASLSSKLRQNFCNNQQIATSSGSNDSGLFNVSFDYDARYLPFEGTGAVSDWELEIGLQENPKLCATLGQALAVTTFIASVDVQQLVDFIKAIQAQPKLADSFHNEVMNRIKTKMSGDDLTNFTEQMLADKDLNSWFNNLGSKNLNQIVRVLQKINQKDLAAKLTAYLKSVKGLPADIVDTAFAKGTVLNITDVSLQIAYTSRDGGAAYKEKVRALMS